MTRLKMLTLILMIMMMLILRTSHHLTPEIGYIEKSEIKIIKRDGPCITRVNPAHPRYRMRRNHPVNLEFDTEVLQDLPYLNTTIKVGELNKLQVA